MRQAIALHPWQQHLPVPRRMAAATCCGGAYGSSGSPCSPPNSESQVSDYTLHGGDVMSRPRTFVILLGAVAAAAATVAVVRHGRGAATGRRVPGGILIGDAVAYDAHSRLLLGSLFRPIAADVAAVAPEGARVLEVGCGPGHLSIRLARQHGLDVTGLDLDPAMIERARANANRVW